MNPNPPTILLFNSSPDAGVEWAQDSLRKTLPNAVVTVLDLDRSRNIWRQWEQVLGARTGRYDGSIFPYQQGYWRHPWYWMQVIMFLVGSVGSRSFMTLEAGLVSPQEVANELLRRIVERLSFLWPFISIAILLRLPIYFFQQILGKFVLVREDPDDEIVGFGEGKGVGGLIYWLTWTQKVKRYGLFGLAHDTYMGMPISVHSWPLAVAILGKLGYRRYVYFSAILFGIGIGWLSLASKNWWPLSLIPLVWFSTYFLFNIYVGTWEILVWGFGCLTFAAASAHLPLVAGIFLAAAVLTHPGGGFLISGITAAFMVLSGYPFVELLWLGILTAVLTFWWIVPYLKSRHKLGRGFMINNVWKYPYAWNKRSIYQFIIYALFFLIAIMAASPVWALLLLLPLATLYYNIKIHWSFSQYTVCNYMLFVGAIYLTVHPISWSFLIYLLVIYTSGEMLWPGTGSLWGFDLTPVVLAGTRRKVKDLFMNLKPGRIAMEMAKSRAHIGWTLAGPIGYILADENLEVLNPGYTEIGDFRIFEQSCQYFNAQATSQEFETACQESGVKYMVAFTDEFCQQLDMRGYKRVDRLSGLCFSGRPNRPSSNLTLYELPWHPQVIIPETQFQILPGEIRFKASAGQAYVLKYSAFAGWRAFQQGAPIPIQDARPGMILTPKYNGEVIIRYRYRHYWL